MLAGPAVVEDTLATYLRHEDKPFAERLLRAMDAGERAGGDKRGRQAAALRIVGTEEYPVLDLRVDDHADAVAELWRLYEVAHERFLERAKLMPTRTDPRRHPRFRQARRRDRAAARDARHAGFLGVLEEPGSSLTCVGHRTERRRWAGRCLKRPG